jgi:hypothetical protein
MSEQLGQLRTCPNCNAGVPPGAQYCPSCGTRLQASAGWDAKSFEDAIADVLEDDTPPQATTWDSPAATPPPPQQESQEWTATTATWSSAPPATAGAGTGWGVEPDVRQSRFGGNRALWIILTIFGFLVFCCCALVFLSVAVASTSAPA